MSRSSLRAFKQGHCFCSMSILPLFADCVRAPPHAPRGHTGGEGLASGLLAGARRNK